ncbi:MAG: hypothetical protein ABIE03_06150 [Patescibacteria group bacterium]|nr:hypothetical protein [Patescibacteria group bacterium]
MDTQEVQIKISKAGDREVWRKLKEIGVYESAGRRDVVNGFKELQKCKFLHFLEAVPIHMTENDLELAIEKCRKSSGTKRAGFTMPESMEIGAFEWEYITAVAVLELSKSVSQVHTSCSQTSLGDRRILVSRAMSLQEVARAHVQSLKTNRDFFPAVLKNGDRLHDTDKLQSLDAIARHIAGTNAQRFEEALRQRSVRRDATRGIDLGPKRDTAEIDRFFNFILPGEDAGLISQDDLRLVNKMLSQFRAVLQLKGIRLESRDFQSSVKDLLKRDQKFAGSMRALGELLPGDRVVIRLFCITEITRIFLDLYSVLKKPRGVEDAGVFGIERGMHERAVGIGEKIYYERIDRVVGSDAGLDMMKEIGTRMGNLLGRQLLTRYMGASQASRQAERADRDQFRRVQ